MEGVRRELQADVLAGVDATHWLASAPRQCAARPGFAATPAALELAVADDLKSWVHADDANDSGDPKSRSIPLNERHACGRIPLI